MKKLLLIIGIIVIISLSGFTTKDEKKKEDKKTETTETTISKTDKDSEKFKEDLQKSVLEFIGDIKANPDTCYIPFKK